MAFEGVGGRWVIKLDRKVYLSSLVGGMGGRWMVMRASRV